MDDTSSRRGCPIYDGGAVDALSGNSAAFNGLGWVLPYHGQLMELARAAIYNKDSFGLKLLPCEDFSCTIEESDSPYVVVCHVPLGISPAECQDPAQLWNGEGTFASCNGKLVSL